MAKISQKLPKIPKVKEKIAEVQREIVDNLKNNIVSPSGKTLDSVVEKLKGQEFLESPTVKKLMKRVKAKIKNDPVVEEVKGEPKLASSPESEPAPVDSVGTSVSIRLAKLTTPFTDGAQFARQLGERIMERAEEVKKGLKQSQKKISKKARAAAESGKETLNQVAEAAITSPLKAAIRKTRDISPLKSRKAKSQTAAAKPKKSKVAPKNSARASRPQSRSQSQSKSQAKPVVQSGRRLQAKKSHRPSRKNRS